jgi:hypothetical protein
LAAFEVTICDLELTTPWNHAILDAAGRGAAQEVVVVKAELVPLERVESAILIVRGHRVMLDADLAALYGVETKALNQAVKRNSERFPEDFMFQLTLEEAQRARSQIVTLNVTVAGAARPPAGQGPIGRGQNIKYLPYVFTEQGVAMLSSVLRSPRAVQVNIEIMRAFVKLRRLLGSNADLARKLAALERKYDVQFQAVFKAIRQLMAPPVKPGRRIGFGGGEGT